jgi:hypothetical protein
LLYSTEVKAQAYNSVACAEGRKLDLRYGRNTKNEMLKKLLMVATLTTVSVCAFASDAARAAAQKTLDLKDGSTVYIFKDGKMAMEDKFGRAMRMKKGVVMETKDGQKIMMHGDEVMCLESLMKEGHEGG